MRARLLPLLMSVLALAACGRDADTIDREAPADGPRGQVEYMMGHDGLRFFPAVQTHMARIARDVDAGTLPPARADEDRLAFLQEFKRTHKPAIDSLMAIMPKPPTHADRRAAAEAAASAAPSPVPAPTEGPSVAAPVATPAPAPDSTGH